VPLLFSTPDQRRGKAPAARVEIPVGLGDLLPTFCSLGDAQPPRNIDGVDLTPALEGETDPPERPIFCDALSPRWGQGTEFRSIRWKNYKYVTFRDAPPLMFDLEDDPQEHRDLVRRGAEGDAAEAMRYLEGVAEESIDFEEAERERIERDGDLRDEYAMDAPEATGNLYILPDGRVVNADDTLYNPTVIAEEPNDIFDDCEQEDGGKRESVKT
jgi:choline-sulfatase